MSEMTREGATRAIKAARDIMFDYAPVSWAKVITRLDEGLAVLSSCACGGRKPIETRRMTAIPRRPLYPNYPGEGWIEIGSLQISGVPIRDTRVDVLVFALPEVRGSEA